MCLHLPSLALGRCEKPQRKHSETHEEDSWVTPWRRCMQVHLQGSYLCFVWFINNAVSFVIFWLFVGPQAYLRIRYLLLQAQRMNLKLQTNRNKCWERVWWVCVHRQLSPPPRVQPTSCAQQVSRRTHSRAPDARTFFLLLHLGECRASFDAPPPPLRPFYPVSCELIYVSLMSQHVRLDLSSLFASFFLHHRRGGGEHILSTICFFFVLWLWLKPPRGKERGRQREM